PAASALTESWASTPPTGSVTAAPSVSRWVSTPITPSMVPASLLIVMAPLCHWPGRVGLEDTARRFCDGSQPKGWTGCSSGQQAAGQVDAGTRQTTRHQGNPRVPEPLRVMPDASAEA